MGSFTIWITCWVHDSEVWTWPTTELSYSLASTALLHHCLPLLSHSQVTLCLQPGHQHLSDCRCANNTVTTLWTFMKILYYILGSTLLPSPKMELLTLGLILGSCWLMLSSRWRFPICLSLVLRLQLELCGSEEWPLHQKLTFSPTQATQHSISKTISCFCSVVCFVWGFWVFCCFVLHLVLGF